ACTGPPTRRPVAGGLSPPVPSRRRRRRRGPALSSPRMPGGAPGSLPSPRTERTERQGRGLPMIWWELFDPFAALGNAATKVAADAWTAAMLSVWNAALWLLRVVLTIE